MKAFSPEFAQQGIAASEDAGDDFAARRDDEQWSKLQQEALQALAERVRAARSTV